MSTTRPVALVTGAAGGIGSVVIALLAKQGWAVVGVDLVEQPAGDASAWVAGDVRDDATVQRAVDAAAGLGTLACSPCCRTGPEPHN
jgi:NAD(P)-dependent dehydrogenase (short-subunit alcohol dehydrogenase family)